jgi:hypothetical protein
MVLSYVIYGELTFAIGLMMAGWVQTTIEHARRPIRVARMRASQVS